MLKKGIKIRYFTIMILLIMIFKGMIVSANIQYETGGNWVRIYWDKPKDRGGNKVIGYKVYRRQKDSDTYILLNPSGPVRNNEFIDNGIKGGNIYYYSVTAIDTREMESPLSKELAVKPEILPPTGLSASSGKWLVELRWDQYVQCTIRGYYVYRSDRSGGPYSKTAMLPYLETSYRDTNVVPQHNYYYVITVEDLFGAESAYSKEVSANPSHITSDEMKALEDIQGLNVTTRQDMIIVDWDEGTDEYVTGYNVYRRVGEGNAEWQLLTRDGPIRMPPFNDREIQPGNIYYYTVVGLDKFGNEGRFPMEVRVLYQGIFILGISVSGADRPLKAGDRITIEMIGTPRMKSYFIVEGISSEQIMEEIESENESIYHAVFDIPPLINKEGVTITCFLENRENQRRISKGADVSLTIDNTPPPAPLNIRSYIDYLGKLELLWETGGGTGDIVLFKIYKEEIGDPALRELIKEIRYEQGETGYSFKDFSALPGREYTYYITSIDLAGNESPIDDTSSLFVRLPDDETPPGIYDLRLVNNLDKEDISLWYAGEELIVYLKGEPGCSASFMIGDSNDILMLETQEGGGEYIGSHIFEMGEEARGVELKAKLVDIAGNITYHTLLTKISVLPLSDGPLPVIFSLEADYPDELIAGDQLTLKAKGTPGCRGLFGFGIEMYEENQIYLDWSGFEKGTTLGDGMLSDISGYIIYNSEKPPLYEEDMPLVDGLHIGQTKYLLNPSLIKLLKEGKIWIALIDKEGHKRLISTPRWDIPLIETEKGVYEGSYEIKGGDRIVSGNLYLTLTDAYGRVSRPYKSNNTITIDTSSGIDISINPIELRADDESESIVLIKLTDRRGNPLKNRELELGLFTTLEEYTGIQGLGRIQGYKERAISGNPYTLITSEAGVAEFVYRAGNAAKTAIFRIRDKVTNDTRTGYLTSFIESTIDIKVNPLERNRKDGFDKYRLSISSEQTWLTADGISKTRIIAKVVDENGNPVEGHKISFVKEMGDGSLSNRDGRDIHYGLSDQGGDAVMIYRAGTRIGTVIITAYDDFGNRASVMIDLKSDAPVEIILLAEPAAVDPGGFSIITVNAQDNNKNPCKNVGLEMEIMQGGGEIITNRSEIESIAYMLKGHDIEVDNRAFCEAIRTDPLTYKSFIDNFSGSCSIIYQAGDMPGNVNIKIRITSRVPNEREFREILWKEEFPWH